MQGDSKTLSSPVGGSKTNPKPDMGKGQSIYVELQSIRIGEDSPVDYLPSRNVLAIKTTAS
jgi:hypothetical protein